MKKQEALQLIESTFNNAFDENKFTLFIKNFLNDIDATKYNQYKGNYIKDAYTEHINQYKRIGKYIDPDGEALDVLIVEVKDQSKLDRARTTLRNFIITHLDNFEKDHALVAFYSKSDGGADWRFSYVKLEYKTEVTEGKLKQKKELTPAKRYSFLVGEHERAHTAKTQILPLLQNVFNNPTLAQIEETFSIEAVTDEFFEQYKLLFGKLVEQFEKDKILQAELERSEIRTDRFAKKLLGQIVFLYFLQKKGWLGVPKEEKWGKGDKNFIQSLYDKAINEDKNFYGDYLQYLFYEALAKEHNDESVKGYYAKLNSRIPFLNGGLFEADYQWETASITIPNHLFRNDEKLKSGDEGTGILDVFDRYNFTIKEDEPLDKEVAVDPEMLGKVFENMLEVTERKSKGAFYTPREIVHYMCQESLIHYLNNSINSKSYAKPKIPIEDLEEYIRKGFFSLENDLRVLKEGKETKTYKFKLPESIRKHADELDKCISNIKICDPAIGSGAFPVGLLLELVNAQLVLRQYLSPNYFEKKLKELELTQQEFEANESRYTYRLKRHSIQESIYGVDIDASAIDVARLRLWLSLVVDEEDLDNIEALPNLDYKIVCGNSLIGLPDTAMRDLKVQEELEKLKDKFFAITNDLEKKELRSTINEKIRQLLDSAEQFSGYKIDFDFKLFFSEVWREKDGFDIVIGNPPYVNIYLIPNWQKNLFSQLYTTAYKKYDLYILFFEAGIRLLDKNENGVIGLITSNKYFSQPYGTKVREILLKKRLEEIINFRFNIFKATVDSAITFLQNKSPENYFKVLDIKSQKDFQKLSSKERTFFEVEIINDLPGKEFRFEIENKDIPLIRKIKAGSIEFDNVCYINYGCRLVAKDKSKTKKDYIFKENENSKLKPFIEGSDIRKFKIINQKYVNYQPDEHYLSLFKELFENQKLVSKDVVGKEGISVAWDSYGYYDDHTVINAVLWHDLTKVNYKGVVGSITKTKINESSKFNYPFLLLIINSQITNYFFKKLFNIDLHFYPGTFQKMPIPSGLNQEQIFIISSVSNYLLYAIEKNHALMIGFFEDLGNALIYELYFSQELKSAGKEILKHIQGLKPISDDITEEQKLSIIQSEFERLYDPNHPVRNAVETMDSIEEIKTIKEALKK